MVLRFYVNITIMSCMRKVGLWPVAWQSTVMYESYTTGGEHSICLGGVVVCSRVMPGSDKNVRD